MSFDPFAEAPRPMVGKGYAWPPAGWVNLWNRAPKWWKPADGPARHLMSAEDWHTLRHTNTTANRAIAYRTDEDQYHEADHWEMPVKYGDCEDYALAKRLRLRRSGWAPGCCRVAVCKTRRGQPHAVLLVDVDAGAIDQHLPLTLVLDNTTDVVTSWHYHRYRWLAREVPGRFLWERIVPGHLMGMEAGGYV